LAILFHDSSEGANSGGDARRVPGPSPTSLLGIVGIFLCLVAGSDIALTWLPHDLGNREWEFGTVTATFNGMLSVTLGVVFVLIWARESRASRALLFLFGALSLATLFLAGVFIIYLTNLPLALDSVPDGNPVRTGLLKAITKTVAQGVLYVLGYAGLAWLSLRWRPGKGRGG